jgi:hypothetical protein
VKFLIDMPLSPELASWLAQKGHDVIHAFQVDLASSSDETILEYARREERVIVTADLDYLLLGTQSLPSHFGRNTQGARRITLDEGRSYTGGTKMNIIHTQCFF